MLPIFRTLPPVQVHHTNNTLYHKVTYRIQSGQRYVSTGQALSPRNILTYAQNNPAYHNETKRKHPPTTNPPSPYTNRRVGLNIYSYLLPPTATLQLTSNTCNNTAQTNHATRYSTPPPSEINDVYSQTQNTKKREISLSLHPRTHTSTQKWDYISPTHPLIAHEYTNPTTPIPKHPTN